MAAMFMPTQKEKRAGCFTRFTTERVLSLFGLAADGFKSHRSHGSVNAPFFLTFS